VAAHSERFRTPRATEEHRQVQEIKFWGDYPAISGAEGDPSGATPAIPLNARRTQTPKAMGLESVFPEEELFLRQLVDVAGLLDGDHSATHCDDKNRPEAPSQRSVIIYSGEALS